MGKEKGVWQLYEYDYKTGDIKLKNRKCPRCGKTMAHHSNPPRWTCGGCSYTEYIREKKQG
ncbi:MAG: 30S ribosomal protein S27ae [Candidatus Hecatellaceae archaeon]|nr:MAG: 30S ribosomal protein S27ae [Candidatus Hecatellales archaeon]